MAPHDISKDQCGVRLEASSPRRQEDDEKGKETPKSVLNSAKENADFSGYKGRGRYAVNKRYVFSSSVPHPVFTLEEVTVAQP